MPPRVALKRRSSCCRHTLARLRGLLQSARSPAGLSPAPSSGQCSSQVPAASRRRASGVFSWSLRCAASVLCTTGSAGAGLFICHQGQPARGRREFCKPPGSAPASSAHSARHAGWRRQPASSASCTRLAGALQRGASGERVASTKCCGVFREQAPSPIGPDPLKQAVESHPL